MQCLWCHNGDYEVSGAGNEELAKTGAGVKGVGRKSFAVLLCNKCGNVQSFSLDADDAGAVRPDQVDRIRKLRKEETR